MMFSVVEERENSGVRIGFFSEEIWESIFESSEGLS